MTRGSDAEGPRPEDVPDATSAGGPGSGRKRAVTRVALADEPLPGFDLAPATPLSSSEVDEVSDESADGPHEAPSQRARTNTGAGSVVSPRTRAAARSAGRTAARGGQSSRKGAASAPGRGGKRTAGMEVKPISVSVQASLAAAWKQRAKRSGTTQADFLLHAVASHKDELAQVVRDHQLRLRTKVAASGDGLFVTKVGHVAEEPYVAISLRMLAANIDILDGLVHESGAESRSALIAAALSATLLADAEA